MSMIKTLFFSEENLEEKIKHCLTHENIFRHFCKLNYESIVDMFYSLFTYLSTIFKPVYTEYNIDYTTTSIIREFSGAINNFDISNIFSVCPFDLSFRSTDIINEKINVLFYENLYCFIENNYSSNNIDEIFEDICFSVSFVFEYICCNIVSISYENEDMCEYEKIVYISNFNRFLVFFVYKKRELNAN